MVPLCCCQGTALLPRNSTSTSRPLPLGSPVTITKRQLKPPDALQEHGTEALAFAAAAALGGPPLAKAVYEELVSTGKVII